MSLIFNGKAVEDVVYNGVTLCKLVYNGTLVWEKHAEVVNEVVVPTCTTIGYTIYKCSRCNATRVGSHMDATGHSIVKDSAVAATCTTTGLTAGSHCSVCGEVIAAQTVTNALGHNYGDWTVTLNPTCSASGATRRDCSRCDAYETASLPATGNHTWKDATCTAPKTCTVCGATSGSALGHNYNSVVTAPTCTAQGYTTHTCSRCGNSYKDSYISTPGHSWNTPTYSWNGTSSCTATRTCKNNSSHTETSTATITSAVTTAATCTTSGVRTYTATFGASWATKQTKTETISATGHNWNAPTYSWDTKKLLCTATRTCKNNSSHTETATASGVNGEVTSAITTAATCTTAGVRTYTATFNYNTANWAGKATTTETIPAKGHTSSDWIVTQAATTTSTGTRVKKCTVCGTVLETETIPKLELPTLVAPVITDVGISEGVTLEFAIKNNNSVAVNCYVEIFDDADTEVFSGECKISANGTYAYGVDLTSSYDEPYEIYLEFTASGYIGNNSVNYVE